MQSKGAIRRSNKGRKELVKAHRRIASRMHANAKKRGHAKSLYKNAITYQAAAASYTEAMLRNILNANDNRVSQNASLLMHCITSIADGMRTEAYRNGFSIGKELYRMLNSDKHYETYEESIPGLVSFFENAGLGNVAYAAFEDMLSLDVYSNEHRYVGSSIHVFESGIISGFVSSGRRNYSIISERACANNNSDHCEFVLEGTGYRGAEPVNGNIKGKELLDMLLGHIHRPHYSNEYLSSSYMALLSAVVADRRYIGEMNSIMRYIGSSIGDTLAKKGASSRLQGMLNVLDSIYTGMVEVRSKKPMSFIMSFDGTKLNEAYVRLSLSLVEGIFSRAYSTKKMKAIEINRYNLHKIKIAEER
ncbi:MAG: hypothetical protein M1360_01825 [Candidatus Marsarchaeota archaeon]|jgi:predicted hydrocarbon binding protein|nr:hypothetical protein [Candidatus Marsarchaeota archaeon]MCL5418660.1 hypothetical protein [Candidatus Marsarchaeota archaeon]